MVFRQRNRCQDSNLSVILATYTFSPVARHLHRRDLVPPFPRLHWGHRVEILARPLDLVLLVLWIRSHQSHSPVLADSKIPKGAISFMKESMRVGLADLSKSQQSLKDFKSDLHFDDAVVRADIEYLASKLMCEMCYRLEVFVFMP